MLAKKNYSEADRIIVLFTKGGGKKVVLAKGIRKPKSKKRGALEIFNLIKYSAHSGHGMDILTEVEVINSFDSVNRSLRKIAVAYFFAEAVGRLTREGEKHPEVFELLVSKLGELEKRKEHLAEFRADFTQEILTLLGFWPRGRKMQNPDQQLEDVIERSLSSIRVGKKILT